jgi:hypothetical protein
MKSSIVVSQLSASQLTTVNKSILAALSAAFKEITASKNTQQADALVQPI